MKVLFLGDVHGITTWDAIVDHALRHLVDKIVFVGDYLDSRMITNGIDIYDNFKNIIELKKKYPDKIDLLLGNHDYNYMMGHGITGFDPVMFHDYHDLLKANWDLFDLAWGAWKDGKYWLVSHAGLRKQYWDGFILPELAKDGTISKLIEGRSLDMHETLNYFKDKFSILWQVGWRTSFPFGPGSIIWADKGEILEDGYPGINQIIGHTPSFAIEKIEKNGDELYFINLNERTKNVGSLILTF